jgi:hypothetical protein
VHCASILEEVLLCLVRLASFVILALASTFGFLGILNGPHGFARAMIVFVESKEGGVIGQVIQMVSSDRFLSVQ